MTDPVTMSLRDLARLMIVVSDNAATDVVMARLGLPAVKQALTDLDLPGTDVGYDWPGSSRPSSTTPGSPPSTSFVEDPTAELLDSMRALQRDQVNVGTARDLTRLLRLLWDDEAAAPDRCALGRDILLQQVWPHRLASGFPEDGITTGGKTGTLPRVRNEVGVVTYPDGNRYAVAVFTKAESLSQKNPAADAVIGRTAVSLWTPSAADGPTTRPGPAGCAAPATPSASPRRRRMSRARKDPHPRRASY